MAAPKKTSATKKQAAKTLVKKAGVKKTASPVGKVAKTKPSAGKKATSSATKSVAAKKGGVAKKASPAKKAPVKKAAAKKKTAPPRGLPEILRDAALKVLDDRQGEGIVTFDLHGRSPIADYAIVASGRSSRQLAAIAEYLREAFMAAGVKPVRVEGKEQGDWVLVDSGDVIVHLFRPEVRQYYQIEDIWEASPSRRK